MTWFFPAVIVGMGVASAANAQLYDFTINPAGSGLSGPLSLAAQTTGTLIGDYDSATTPTGTRTKPGLVTPFGDTENIAVAASLALALGGPINTSTAGFLRLDLDPGTGTLVMTNFAADFLSDGSVNLPITLDLQFESFRTRSPSSTYFGGLPINLPIGSAGLTQLTATQIGSGAGVLLQTGATSYDFSLAAVMLLAGEVSALGESFQFPGLATPIAFAGSIVVDGSKCRIDVIHPAGFCDRIAARAPAAAVPATATDSAAPGWNSQPAA